MIFYKNKVEGFPFSPCSHYTTKVAFSRRALIYSFFFHPTFRTLTSSRIREIFDVKSIKSSAVESVILLKQCQEYNFHWQDQASSRTQNPQPRIQHPRLSWITLHEVPVHYVIVRIRLHRPNRLGSWCQSGLTGSRNAHIWKYLAMRAINTTEATGWKELKPFWRLPVSMIIDWIVSIRGTQLQFSENICWEGDLRSRIFGTFVVKFLTCLSLLGFWTSKKWYNCPF